MDDSWRWSNRIHSKKRPEVCPRLQKKTYRCLQMSSISSLGAGKPIFWVPSQKSAISLPVCRQAWIWYNSIQSLFSLVNFQKKLVKKCFSEIFNMFLPKSSPYLKYSGNITGESCSLPTGWLMRRKGLICDVFIVWKYEVRIGVFKSEIKEIFLRNPV